MSIRVRLALVTLLCLKAFTLTIYAQRSEGERTRPSARLYQVSMWDENSHRKKFGFIDKTGKLVIDFDRLPATTRSVGEFQEGRALIYLDKEGTAAPKSRADYAAGYIDETGEVVIEPRFQSARDFSEGLAYATSENFRGFVDLQGRVVIRIDNAGNDSREWGTVRDFHEGLALVGLRLERGWGVGFINRSGGLVFKGQYAFADDFSEGLAGVAIDGKYGFVNRQGELVIPARFEVRRGSRPFREDTTMVSSGRFKEGLACVGLDGLYGYINKKGDFQIPPQFREAREFSEGLAWVVTSDGKKRGWIDKTGQWAITRINSKSLTADLSQYTQPGGQNWNYSEGLLPFVVSDGGRVLRGYINRNGDVVIVPRELKEVGPFVGGVARVSFYEKSDARREGARGYVDRAGQYMEEKFGYIDRNGQLIWRSQ